MIEERLERSLTAYRDEVSSQPPPLGAWDRVNRRAAQRPRRARLIVAGLTAATAVLVAALSLVIPQRRDSPADTPDVAMDELVYISYQYSGGRVVTRDRLISREPTTGRERVLVSGTPGECGVSPIADQLRQRVLYCQDDELWLLDLTTRKRSPLTQLTDVGSHMGWTRHGVPVFLRSGANGAAIVYQSGQLNVVYESPSFLYDAVVTLGDNILATIECSDEHCAERGEMLVVQFGSRDESVLYRRSKAYPLVSFDEGNALLYQYEDAGTIRLATLRYLDGRVVSEDTTVTGTFGSSYYGAAVVGPDGTIALAGNLAGERRQGIFVFDPASSTLRRVTSGGGPLAWTRDGRAIVHGGQSTDVIRITDLEGNSRVLVRGKDVRVVAAVTRPREIEEREPSMGILSCSQVPRLLCERDGDVAGLALWFRAPVDRVTAWIDGHRVAMEEIRQTGADALTGVTPPPFTHFQGFLERRLRVGTRYDVSLRIVTTAGDVIERRHVVELMPGWG